MALTTSLVVGLLLPLTATGNPHHFAGDYVLFAKALADGITDSSLAFEPNCADPDTSGNQGQGETSGENNQYFGRIHSNADLKLNGANFFRQTVSPDTEITFGVHDNAPPPSPDEPDADCLLQNDVSNVFDDGDPENITGTGDPTSVQGPYQIGPGGWPGNLGSFLTQTGDDAFETFTNDSPTSAVGLSCDKIGDPVTGTQTTLDGTETIEIKSDNFADYEGRVICNGTGKIVISANLLGTPGGPGTPPTPPPVPFRITMLSHGPIETPGQGNVLAPTTDGHGVLAWTDVPFSTEASGIKLNGSDLNVPERSILFAPRGGVDVSGSNDDDVCIQAIGQGIVKVAGSTSRFGPFGPGCGTPANVVTDIHANLGGNAHTSLGQSGAVEVGTEVHDKVTVSSTANANLTGTITVSRFDNGTCSGTPALSQTFGPAPTDFALGTTVVLDPVLSFTPAVGVYSYRASYSGDPTNLAATGACEGPLQVVDAQIDLSPLTDINKSGDAHTITATVQQDDGYPAGAPGVGATGFGPAPDGTLVTFNLLNNDANAQFVGGVNTCTTTGGSCSVQINTPEAGGVDIHATTTFSIGGRSVTRATGTGGLNSADAHKDYVNARISIAPTETNKVGEPHTFTVTVEKDTGPGFGPAAGEDVDFTLTDANGAVSVLDATASTCDNSGANTNASGQCTIVFTSASAGTVTGNATANIVVGGLTFNLATNGTAPNSGPAVKTYVNARISITPTETNKVGEPHTFTVTVQKDTGNGSGFVAAAGEDVDFTLTNANGAVSVLDAATSTCDNAGANTNASGQCTIVFSSASAGTVTGNATATVVLSGLTFNLATNGTAPNSGPAVKTFVNARISLDPLTDTNPIGTNHTVTVDVDVNPGTGFVAATVGDVTFTLTNSGGATATLNAALSTCDDGDPDNLDANGRCTIVFSSPTAGTTTVNASVTVTVGGETIIRTTGTAANTAAGGTGDASKTWQAGGALFLLIDEDSIDNGIRFHDNPTIGQQNIFPSTQTQFSDVDVNDQIARIGQRAVLQYWAQNVGKTIALMTGQTGDEGWFAPNCAPLKWISGSSNNCINPLTATAQFNQALGNFLAGTVRQNRLDNIKDVRPLRARGIEMLEGQTVCAVVYDSDISINYRDTAPHQIGNLQGATLGIVAFTVLDNGVNQMNEFSSSTLPEAQIRIESAAEFCGAPFELLGAPIPGSSSVPNDIDPHSTADDGGYRDPLPPAPPIP